ncbi:MAG: hypothetical protein U5K28_04465 [Halobacteriales archaeon]|nr:hypothetical protein [Halobacteriales archaeon]
MAVGLRVDTTGATADGLLDDDRTRAGSRARGFDSDADTSKFDLSKSTVQTGTYSWRFTAWKVSAGDTVTFDASQLELDRAGNASLLLDNASVQSGSESIGMSVNTGDTTVARSLVADTGAEPLGAARVTVTTGSVG